MGKILYHGNRKKEKGLTLTETVVSLAIIIIVAVAAASIAVFSSNSFKKSGLKQHFVQEIDSILNLYLSYDSIDFSKAMNNSFGITISGFTDSIYYLNTNYEYLENENGHSYYLVFDFEDTPSLSLSAYKKDNSLIYSRSVNK